MVWLTVISTTLSGGTVLIRDDRVYATFWLYTLTLSIQRRALSTMVFPGATATSGMSAVAVISMGRRTHTWLRSACYQTTFCLRRPPCLQH